MATPRKTRIKVGVIGLGIIGARVAANLRGAGHQVYVWSRSPHSAPNFLGSVVEVADLCDLIQIFVSDDAALLEVVRTIAAALSSRHLLTAHSTVSPATTRQAAAIVEGLGARYLDAPFTGSKAAAQNKQLVYYVGGDEAVVNEARPVLELTSKKVLHVGKVGDATILKLATNILTATTVQTLAEMQALVRAAGIDEHRLVEALENNSSRSGTSDLKLPTMIEGNFEPSFSLKHMLKDARLALALAESFKLPLPLLDTTTEVLTDSIEEDAGWGDLDFSVITKNYDALVPPRAAAPPPVLPPRPEPAQPPATATSPTPAKSLPTASAPMLPSAAKPPTAAPAASLPAAGAKPAEPPADDAILSTPIPDAEAASLRGIALDRPAPIGGDPGGNPPRKNTLRVIRDFFKPAQS